MKIKFENYLELHRMATSLSTTMVYEWFCEKKSLADLLEISPDEFHPWVKEQWNTLQTSYDTLLKSYKRYVSHYDHFSQREFALEVMTHPQKGVMFSVRSGKDVFNQITKLIKPKTEEKLQWNPKESQESVKTETQTPAKRKQTITLMIGISGSGKSTAAQQQITTSPNTIIVSRDTIREQLFGYTPETITRYYEAPNLTQKEELVTQVEQSHIDVAASLGYDVIVDDTNLTQKTIKQFFIRFPEAEFKYKVCECDVEEAIKRCSQRSRKVSEDIIRNQNTKLRALQPYLEELFGIQPTEPIVQDVTNTKAVIVDLDGTLALMGSRNAFDWTRVEEDTLNQPVYYTIKALEQKGYTIILCSGRSEEALEGTKRWLEKNGVTYTSLHMRPKGDSRPDYIVKEEMWRHLVRHYYIEFMLDDRNSVVNHARRLGFTVFQVAPGNF